MTTQMSNDVETMNVGTVFAGSLEGFDKEMKNLVLETIANGWNGRLSSNGHAILNHPSGLTVAVSRSARTLVQAKAAIKRVETQTVPSEDWHFLGETRRILFNGSIYRCAICDYTNPNLSQVSGHFVGTLVDRRKQSQAQRKKKEEQKQPESSVIEKEESEILSKPEVEEKWIQEPLPGMELEAIGSTDPLVEWLRSVPMASIEAFLKMAEDNNRLKEENKKLRDTLNALISLAKEI